MAEHRQVQEAYGVGGVGDLPIFPGDLTNFGYWKDIEIVGSISKQQKVLASQRLYCRVLDELSIAAEDTIIEVGCGRGQGLAVIDCYNPRKVIGIDATLNQLSHHTGKNPVVQAFSESLPFGEASVDVVVSIEAIQHFKDPLAFVQECSRIVGSKGRVGITSYFGTEQT